MVVAGATSLLLEGTTREVYGIITERVGMPEISYGSGPDCHVQVLIITNIIGQGFGRIPKFSKKYADLETDLTGAFSRYLREVRE